MNYPSKDELEAVLSTLAKQVGDQSARPFRVDPLPVHGSRGSPMYTVVILSKQGLLLREKLSGIGTSSRSEPVDQFRATIKADRAKWAEIVKASGAKVD